MKQLQFSYKCPEGFRKALLDAKKDISKFAKHNPMIYVNWTRTTVEEVKSAIAIIDEIFPDAQYFGNETSGNVLDGDLAFGVCVTLFVPECSSSRAQMLWVQKGTEIETLDDLWKRCKKIEDLKGIELIPSLSYLGVLGIEGNVPDLPEEVQIFGGAAVGYDLPCFAADIVAKGHGITQDGMAVIVYSGPDIHFRSSHVLGWKGLGRYMKVTKADNNIIQEIDGAPAFNIFEKYINLSYDDQQNFAFPLISEEEGVEYIRTPQVVMPDKSMVMFANVPVGTAVRISYGDKNTILNSIHEEVLDLAKFRPEAVKAFSCAARRLFWGDKEIGKETELIRKLCNVNGFCTGGEIQRIGGKMRVMNQTLSLIAVKEKEGREIKVDLKESAPDKSLVSRLAFFTGKVSEEQEEALAEAEAANKAKTNFLFNMSHDIRTPLNAIIGFSNIAAREIKNPQKALDSIKKAHDSSDLLLSIINDILDMSRIESGKVELKKEPANVMAIMKKVNHVMKPLAAVKDVDLSFRYIKLKDKYVNTDVPFVERILVNIVSNAIKYTLPGGKVSVSIEEVSFENGVGTYKYVISDTGIGMTEEFQKHMYEEFARETNTTISGIQGTGLGLPLAQKLTEYMGGSIDCHSERGVGTTFTLTFPFEIQCDADIEELKGEEARETADFTGKKVLLVEDNELNMEIAYDILREAGLDIECANNGAVAVDMLEEKGPSYYDFILMDVQMPVMDGYEATKAIRTLYPDAKLPIIALSANAFAEDKTASINAGMNDHVAKPININELKKVMSRFI